MWFSEAINCRSEVFTCDSDCVRIHYRGWGSLNSDRPTILFVHGFRAHSHWWDFIAPFFLADYRVFALDLAGMGDSQSRTRYDLFSFSLDIVSVINSISVAPVILIGHSFGGARVLRTCVEFPERVMTAIILDTAFFSSEDSVRPGKPGVGRPVPYPNKEAILARYRLVPEQPAEPYLRRYVAEHSIRQVEGGWRWKFDPNLASLLPDSEGMTLLEQVRVPIDYVCGEASRLVALDRARRITGYLHGPSGDGPIVLPGAHHHLMLDQPLLLIQTIDTLLARRHRGRL